MKEYLEKHHISLRELEKVIGVSYNTIFKITKGRIPCRKTADRIVKRTKGEVSYKDLGFISIDGVWIKTYGKLDA